MKSTNPKPLAFKKRSNESAREQRQTDFLRYLAQGESITNACVYVGISRSCYEKWRNRPEFRAAVESARESHRRDILSGFHTADAYARMLLDAIQRDESLPAALRYRASKSLLSRKGKADWLPEPIPADAAPLAPFEDEEDEHPEASPHAEPAPAPPPRSATNEEAVPTPRPAGPVIVNAAASAVNERIPSDSLIPVYGLNPENPDKTPHPQSAANSVEHQLDPPMQSASSRPSDFFNNPETPLPGPSTESHAATHLNKRASVANVVAPPAAILSQTWLDAQLHHNHESPKSFEMDCRNPLPDRPFLNLFRTDLRPPHHEDGLAPAPGKAQL
ncbi:MAG: helix-turn-helix domain-containing protein [Bryobacterales bacterium]|nr:helix-turn-helix domain-containing protein [Bryobacterales bacterium]